MAIADKALFRFDTLADLQTQEIPRRRRLSRSTVARASARQANPTGNIQKQEASARSHAVEGFQGDIPEHPSAMLGITVRSQFTGFDVSWARKWTNCTPRSSSLSNSHRLIPVLLGQSYVANTSSVDGQGAFLGENHSDIDYFQSLKRFREPGLPCELPACIKERLKQTYGGALTRIRPCSKSRTTAGELY
jgi:hypothetical protein